MITAESLSQAKASIKRLEESFKTLGQKGTEIVTEHCLLEQVSQMIEPYSEPIERLAENLSLRVAVLAIRIVREQANTVMRRVEQARASDEPAGEIRDLQTNLRESHLRPALELLTEIVTKVEEKTRGMM